MLNPILLLNKLVIVKIWLFLLDTNKSSGFPGLNIIFRLIYQED